MLAAAAGDHRPDAACLQGAAILVVVIGAIGDQVIRAQPWTPDLASERSNPTIKGSNWVTSLRLPPVRVIASGIPEDQLEGGV